MAIEPRENSDPSLKFSTRVQHLASALLLFTVLYSLTNIYSAAVFNLYPERIHKLAISFDTAIPFISAFIIPYSWSLLLFIASFFMVRTTKQLANLTHRLLLATALACLVFYGYPARFSFVRPLISDWSAIGYNFLSLTDKPFNQWPSLHVSYALLLCFSLWQVFDKQKSKVAVISYRLGLLIVCSLIIVSTVFTYQHHVVDIIGGIGLTAVVLWLTARIKNKLVSKYLLLAIAGFLLIAISGFFIRAFFNTAVLEYLAIVLGLYWLASFILLAWVYQVQDIRTNKKWFAKNNTGRLTLSTWLSFAPLLLIYKAMSKIGQRYDIYKGKGIKPRITWQPIDNKLGTIATPRLSAPTFRYECCTKHSNRAGSDCYLIVVDVAAEISSHFIAAQADFVRQTPTKVTQAKQSAFYLYLPLLDLQAFKASDVPTFLTLFKQLDDLTAALATTSDQSYQIIVINFHCVMGLSRSIAVQVLYLVHCGQLNLHTYRAWIDEHYCHAHISDYYLPQSLVEAIQTASR